MRLVFTLITLILIQNPIFAQSLDTPLHKVALNETLLEVAEKHFPAREVRYEKIEDYIVDLKKWNPHIKNFEQLDRGAELYLDFPYSPFVSNNYAPSLETSNPNYRPGRLYPGLHLGVAFTASKGDFLESVNNLADIEFQQNSPFSIGLGGVYIIKDSELSFSFSSYWSKLTASSSNVNADTLEVAPEIGANLYLQYGFNNNSWGLYAGGDFEKFSTFNIKDFANFGDTLKTVENTMIFATGGFYKNFSFLSKKALFKFSYAKSVSSTVEKGILRTDESFEGSRYLFFFQHMIGKNWWYHILYKQHELDGPTDLTIQRAGLGFGFSLF